MIALTREIFISRRDAKAQIIDCQNNN